MAIFGLGYGLVFPAATALVIGATGADRRGMAFGIFYAVYSLGVVVGASGSGRLSELSDYSVGLPFLAAAGPGHRSRPHGRSNQTLRKATYVVLRSPPRLIKSRTFALTFKLAV